MIKEKAIKRFLALLLLLCFAAVALPLDLLHNHSQEELSCSDFGQHGHCTHKVHLSKKGSYCFACLIHFDKNFLQKSNGFHFFECPVKTAEERSAAASVVLPTLLTQLRGPPAVII